MTLISVFVYFAAASDDSVLRLFDHGSLHASSLVPTLFTARSLWSPDLGLGPLFIFACCEVTGFDFVYFACGPLCYMTLALLSS